MEISIIIPVYNEAETAEKTINDLRYFLDGLKDVNFEIIAVNDDSSDKSSEILSRIDGIRVIDHRYNKGYGAAIKSGIQNASFDWVLFYDSDGQFRAEEITKLLGHTADYDMVVGARIEKKAPLIRQPGRKFLHILANYLADQKIPDINSGFRLVKKERVARFWHLLPNSFSLTTTLTLAFQKSGLDIKYVPIEVNKRVGGKSTVKPKHAITMFFLILRTIILFSPLRIFMPAVIFLLMLLSVSLAYDIYNFHITNTTVVLFVSSLIIFLFGLLADQISAIRREIRK